MTAANDTFSVQWAGALNVPATENYTFRYRTNDFGTLSIDGTPVIDDSGAATAIDFGAAKALAVPSTSARLTRRRRRSAFPWRHAPATAGRI